MLTNYTSYDEIRAALGVDSDELTDETLGLNMYNSGLDLELASVTLTSAVGGSGTVAERFAIIELIDLATRTSEENAFFQIVGLWATNFVASQASSGLSMRASKSMSDGEAVATRFSSEATFRDVIAKIDSEVARYRDLITKVGITDASTGVLPLFKAASPGTDIVTESVR